MEKNSSLIDILKQELYEELSNVEIIPYKDSIWFIDREKEYWYFEFDKSGTLWWRYHFFTSFFKIFSMNPDNFTPILSSWVEEVLNHKVSTTKANNLLAPLMVGEVLNHKVSTTTASSSNPMVGVGEVLNHKVSTTKSIGGNVVFQVEEVLNHRVSTTNCTLCIDRERVEEVLNYKVSTTHHAHDVIPCAVEDV